jgi:hypothetical protein
MDHIRTFTPKLLGACIALLLIGPTLNAQAPCDDLSLERITYSATDANTIEVVVTNGSTDIFAYPAFTLLDAQGDTLAIEQFSFFGIGMGPQAFHLANSSGTTLPETPFEGTLLLQGLFGDTIYCSWDLTDILLCPAEDCHEAEIYLMNTGSLEAFEVFWWVRNEDDASIVATGSFMMDESISTHTDTLCLPPGNYMLEVSDFSPIDASYILGITSSMAYSLGTNTLDQQDSTPHDLAFRWYERCAMGTQSIAEHDQRSIQVLLQGGSLLFSAADQLALGEISMWTADGRLLAARSSNTSMLNIPTEGMASGIVLTRVVDTQGRSFVQRIFIP